MYCRFHLYTRLCVCFFSLSNVSDLHPTRAKVVPEGLTVVDTLSLPHRRQLHWHITSDPHSFWFPVLSSVFGGKLFNVLFCDVWCSASVETHPRRREARNAQDVDAVQRSGRGGLHPVGAVGFALHSHGGPRGLQLRQQGIYFAAGVSAFGIDSRIALSTCVLCMSSWPCVYTLGRYDKYTAVGDIYLGGKCVSLCSCCCVMSSARKRALYLGPYNRLRLHLFM